MATISRQGSKWRVQVRRVNVPYLSLTFRTYEDAVDWVQENERSFTKNARKYLEAYALGFKDEIRAKRKKKMSEEDLKNVLNDFKSIYKRYFSSDTLSSYDLDLALKEIFSIFHS